jgi:UDP-glucose:(heptosyl)LPS alpha-1,3-glucosyltransferase
VLLRLEKRHFSPGVAKRIVALTPQVRSDLEQWYGVPGENVSTINIGFSPDEFHPASCEGIRPDVRAKFGYGPKDRVVVFVANELERKGFPQLLRAISRLEDPKIKLLAIGRLNTARYTSEIRARGMEGRVHFTGPADPRIGYAAGDVFVLPTQYEAWGLVIVEALACGMPVLTSRLAGASIAVNDANGDLLEDPLSLEEIAVKLRALIDRGEVGRTLIAASVAHFRWDCLLGEYERVLESAAGPATAASMVQ